MPQPNPTRRGPKPKSPTGQPMKRRVIRMDDACWRDAKFIGDDLTRGLIQMAAEILRMKESV